jgi:hypothetical protein
MAMKNQQDEPEDLNKAADTLSRFETSENWDEGRLNDFEI